ncbi:DUF4440 domain-containing protein [Pollutibacter soli]|uniref:DUF4440 domain-containing protein n=1 Tax=Pollutibacter soli TaxID=3034157 RepID=UPI0030134041
MRNPEQIIQLLDIEKKLWTNDPEFYHMALREDAILVFRETGVIGRDFAVDAIRKEKAENRVWEEVALDDVQHTWITDDVVVITYRAAAKWKNELQWHHALASSVYNRNPEGWKMVFHQQTTIEKPTAPAEDVELS